MTGPRKWKVETRNSKQAGFSIIELLVSVAIITLLMAAFFQFVSATQRQHRGNQLLAEIYGGGRGVLEAITQEIQQAGYNPDFTPNTTLSAGISAGSQTVAVASSTGMFPGNDVIVDFGASQEKVTMTAVGHAPDNFAATFNSPHPLAAPIFSATKPFPTGILSTTDGMLIRFYGSQIKKDRLQYIEYSCYPKGANRSVGCPATGTTTIGGTTYNLYTLYRSATDVPFLAATANDGSPVVDNVVSTAVGANAAGGSGPPGTAAPVFHFDTALIGTTTVVTRVTITLTLQTLVRDPDSGQLRTATLRSQIVPRNIVNALAAYAASGNDPSVLPATPAGLPMTP